MYITTTTHTVIKREDGTVKKDQTITHNEHLQTQIQWNAQHYKLRRTAKGRTIAWGTGRDYSGTDASAIFYSEAEVLPMTPREVERYKKQQKQLRKERREEAKQRKAEEAARRAAEQQYAYDHQLATAWQWLSKEHRAPADAAKAIAQQKQWTDGVYWYEGGCWYYYQRCDTVPVSDDIYEQLKQLYISKYGGWEHIDLEHTTYDGHKWWDKLPA